MSAALPFLGRRKIGSIDCNPALLERAAKTFVRAKPHIIQHHELIVSGTPYNNELTDITAVQSRDCGYALIDDFVSIDNAQTREIVDSFSGVHR